MQKQIKVRSVQLNPHLGDLKGNFEKIISHLKEAYKLGIDLVIFSELVLCGYPPEDLLFKKSFLKEIEAYISKLKHFTKDTSSCLIGVPLYKEGKLYNAAILLSKGEIKGIVRKKNLPNYSVFDEERYFYPDTKNEPIDFMGIRLGVLICEDLWSSDISLSLKDQNAGLLIALNASPYEMDKGSLREIQALSRVNETSLPLIYVNQVGGQDELVFDGSSFAFNRHGQKISQMGFCEEDHQDIIFDLSDGLQSDEMIIQMAQGPEALYSSLVLGLRDYVRKNSFNSVLLGLSGGIDSALVAVLAVDALGYENVYPFLLPSPYTSKDSFADAIELADNLGLKLENISIEDVMSDLDILLNPHFKGLDKDITEENIQSRLRGLLLMAISNKKGHMLLATGNKSEMAVGYSTLYGDMCGGFAPLKDVYKTDVIRLCLWRNLTKPKVGLGKDGCLIPENIITKPPTAELRPDQKDEDSLPPYNILDPILYELIENNKSEDDIIELGFDKEDIQKITRLLFLSEYKRRQSPPGIKVSSKAFGKERRYPITNAYWA